MAERSPEVPADWVEVKNHREQRAPKGQFRILAHRQVRLSYNQYIVGDFDHQGRAENEARIISDRADMDTRVVDDRGICTFVWWRGGRPNFQRATSVTKLASLLDEPAQRRGSYKRRR